MFQAQKSAKSGTCRRLPARNRANSVKFRHFACRVTVWAQPEKTVPRQPYFAAGNSPQPS
jgi:hypothetical protein